MPIAGTQDLICLSHLRWDYVYQRPQQLMSRATGRYRVYYVEEPTIEEVEPCLEVRQVQPNLWVATPHLPDRMSQQEMDTARADMLAGMAGRHDLTRPVLWYYTPSPLRFTRQLVPSVTVYDCMDELSLFKNANPALPALEAELFDRADLVFTGGRSLYEAKQDRHPNVHLFPSSIDCGHFAAARERPAEPADQAAIPRPRLGFFGVVDERMDLGLVAGLARIRPRWHIVLLGPTAKVNTEMLEREPNIHLLGRKGYQELPAYLAGWDVALIPFARNDATRFISPTKTPEYLAGGRPVVSTPIRDVVRPYGESGLVKIASTPVEFAEAAEAAMAESSEARQEWLRRVDAMLGQNSWDLTWKRMDELVTAFRAEKF
jgi:glycosyltransferase involved in cell wall biosynthesis